MAFPLVGILRMNGGLLEKALGDLDEDAVARRVVSGANSLLWIAGHLTAARYGMVRSLGAMIECPLPPVFGKGTVVADDAALPPIGAVLEAWREVSTRLPELLSEATDAQLAEPAPRVFPIPDKSLLGMMAFLTFHEGYHIGQMALLRRALGRGGLVDG